jgi:hypothetical protein
LLFHTFSFEIVLGRWLKLIALWLSIGGIDLRDQMLYHHLLLSSIKAKVETETSNGGGRFSLQEIAGRGGRADSILWGACL